LPFLYIHYRLGIARRWMARFATTEHIERPHDN
jgi:hypothetical protein